MALRTHRLLPLALFRAFAADGVRSAPLVNFFAHGAVYRSAAATIRSHDQIKRTRHRTEGKWGAFEKKRKHTSELFGRVCVFDRKSITFLYIIYIMITSIYTYMRARVCLCVYIYLRNTTIRENRAACYIVDIRDQVILAARNYSFLPPFPPLRHFLARSSSPSPSLTRSHSDSHPLWYITSNHRRARVASLDDRRVVFRRLYPGSECAWRGSCCRSGCTWALGVSHHMRLVSNSHRLFSNHPHTANTVTASSIFLSPPSIWRTYERAKIVEELFTWIIRSEVSRDCCWKNICASPVFRRFFSLPFFFRLQKFGLAFREKRHLLTCFCLNVIFRSYTQNYRNQWYFYFE